MSLNMFKNRQQKFVLTWMNIIIITVNGYVVTDAAAHSDGKGYGVIIDAGSSGSKVMVYKWRNPWMQNITPHIKLIYSNKVRVISMAKLSYICEKIGISKKFSIG